MPEEGAPGFSEQFNLNKTLQEALAGIQQRIESIDVRLMQGKAEEADRKEIEELNEARNMLSAHTMFAQCSSPETLSTFIATKIAGATSDQNREAWEWIKEYTK